MLKDTNVVSHFHLGKLGECVLKHIHFLINCFHYKIKQIVVLKHYLLSFKSLRLLYGYVLEIKQDLSLKLIIFIF